MAVTVAPGVVAGGSLTVWGACMKPVTSCGCVGCLLPCLIALATPFTRAAAQAVNATVLPPGGGPAVAVNIGNIAVALGPGANIQADFTFNGAAAGFPAGFAFLDDWYDFVWINLVVAYTVGGVQPTNAGGQPIIPFAGFNHVLPLVDQPPTAVGGDDDLPFYYTNAEWAAGFLGATAINPASGVAGTPPSRFVDARGGWPAGAVITFETYLVVRSVTDPAIAAHEFVVLDGFTWTYTQGPPGGPTAAGGGAIAANSGRINTAMGNAGGGGFPPPGGAGTAAWDARPSGLGPVGRVLTSCPPVAVPQGPGCNDGRSSFYEPLTPPLMDLGGLQLTATNNGALTSPAYVVAAAPGVANPIGSLGPAMSLPLADDQVLPAGTLGLFVSSNCVVYFGPGGSAAFTPSVPTLLNQAPTGCYSWTDLNPAAPGSGLVWYEEAGAVAQITYDQVFGFGTTGRNSVQFVIDRGSGDFRITWGMLSPTNPQPWLVGYSPGGPSLDPGPVDLSSTVVVTAPMDSVPLTLQPLGLPSQGPVAVPFNVLTTNIASLPAFHLGLIGLTSPNVNLGFLGFPGGCVLNASPDVIVDFSVAFAPQVNWTALVLPPSPPSFVGFEFYLQAITLDAGGINLASRASNGLRCVVGN